MNGPVDDPWPVRIAMRTLALLLTLLGAPLGAWRRFARWSDRKLELLEFTLERLAKRGFRLRYDGEDEAVAEKRLALIDWFFADPRKAQRHLGRLARAGYRIFMRPGFALRFAAPAGAPVCDAPVAPRARVMVSAPDSS